MVFKELMKWIRWHLIFFAILAIVLFACSGCSHGREYRIYVHDAHRGLFIRDLKNKDVLTYKEGHGLICMPETEVRKVVDQISTDKAYGRRKK